MGTKRTQRESGRAVRVAAYFRASRDRHKTQRSVDDQAEDYRGALTAHADWCDVGSFKDNDRSASRFATKGRPDFEKLKAAIVAGDIDTLWLWEFSRAQRRLKTFSELSELCAEHHVTWWIQTTGRAFDLDNADDRLALGLNALIAEHEAEQLSRRSRRGVRHNLRTGRPHGTPAYGYLREHDTTTGALLRQVPDPRTAPIVVEIAQRYASGESSGDIGRDLERRGFPTPAGAVRWHVSTVRTIATNPVYVGMRRYEGKQETFTDGSPIGRMHEGAWEPLVTSTLHAQCLARAQRHSDDRPRSRARGTSLLGHILVCGVCGRPTEVNHVKRKADRQRRYRCQVSCTSADADACDEFVVELLLELLGKREYLRALAPDNEAGVKRAREAVAKARQEYEEALSLVDTRELSVRAFARMEPGLLARIEAAEQAETRLVTPGPLAALLNQKGTMAQRWERQSTVTKRAIIRHLVTATLAPNAAGYHSQPVDERLTVAPNRESLS